MAGEVEGGVSVNLEGLEAKMAGPLAPPPPPSVNSSASGFKINSSRPNLNHAPAQPTPTDVVFDTVAKLRERGRLAGLEISGQDDEFPSASLPVLFDLIVTAYLADVAGAVSTVDYPVPPPAIEGGRKVELLRLFLAVRSRGGFHAVADAAAWEDVAVDVGLDPSARPEVELMYADYLADMEICIRDDAQVADQEMVDVIHNAIDQSSEKAKEDGVVTVPIDHASAPSASLKRKRSAMLGMLSWLWMVAASPDEPGILTESHGGHVDKLVRLRDHMFANVDCRRPLASWKTLTGMLDWVRNVATNPEELGVIRDEGDARSFAVAVQVRARMFAPEKVVRGGFKVAIKHQRRGGGRAARIEKQQANLFYR